MGSQIKRVISKHSYNFESIKGTSSLEVVALRSVDVNYGEKAELLVRVHDKSIGANSSVVVTARPVNITREEPSVDYVGSSAVATVTLNNSTSAPSLVLESFSEPFGSAVQIRVKGTCAVAGPESIRATISVDLVCKD